MILDKPLNVAEVPVAAVAPSESNSTSVTVLGVKFPSDESPSESSGKWAISVCAFRLPVVAIINAKNTVFIINFIIINQYIAVRV